MTDLRAELARHRQHGQTLIDDDGAEYQGQRVCSYCGHLGDSPCDASRAIAALDTAEQIAQSETIRANVAIEKWAAAEQERDEAKSQVATLRGVMVYLCQEGCTHDGDCATEYGDDEDSWCEVCVMSATLANLPQAAQQRDAKLQADAVAEALTVERIAAALHKAALRSEPEYSTIEEAAAAVRAAILTAQLDAKHEELRRLNEALSVERIAAALLACGLIRRYQEYAVQTPTVKPIAAPYLASEWAAALRAELVGDKSDG